MNDKDYFVALLSNNFTIENEDDFYKLLNFVSEQGYVHKRQLENPYTHEIEWHYYVLKDFFVNDEIFFQGKRWVGKIDYTYHFGWQQYYYDRTRIL